MQRVFRLRGLICPFWDHAKAEGALNFWSPSIAGDFPFVEVVSERGDTESGKTAGTGDVIPASVGVRADGDRKMGDAALGDA